MPEINTLQAWTVQHDNGKVASRTYEKHAKSLKKRPQIEKKEASTTESGQPWRLTGTVLGVLLILRMEVVNSVRHDVFRIHRFLCKRKPRGW